MDENTKNSAPMNACIFNQAGEAIFADTEDDNRFTILAYTGQVIPNHWFWGNVAFDLSGMKFDKKKTPVLEEHFTDRRIGYTTKQQIDDNVTVEGKYLSNEYAQLIRNDMKEGYPMQASMYIPPLVIEHVADGVTVEVNGHQLRGPGAVFRKSVIKEVSMCTFGADSNTQSKAFAGDGKEQIKFNIYRKEETMADKKTKVEMTAETFAADYPEIHGALVETARAEGAEAERERFNGIVQACGEDHELAVTMFAEGADGKAALQARNEKLVAENKRLAVQMAESKDGKKETVDPATAEFSDDSSKQEKKEAVPRTPVEKYTAEFGASKEIQTEFGGAGGLDDYIAFRKAEEKGLVKIAGRR